MESNNTVAELLERIDAEPSNAELFQSLGLLYLKQGMMEKARDAYDRSLELDPCDAWTHLYLGNWHYALDQFQDAIDCFEYAQRLMPENCAPVWCLGDAYTGLGDEAAAGDAYRRAFAMDPSDETARKRWKEWQESQDDAI